MPFNLLIDYDNIEVSDQTKGLIFIVECVLNKLSPSDIDDKNVIVRLYGGWYQNNSITVKAQNLASEIRHDFPVTVLLSDLTTSVIVNAELAMSLTIQPTIHLVNTYRRNGIPSGLKAKHPISNGCTRSSCPVLHVYNFVQAGICGECNTATVEEMFYRQEQKLVDTMLTSDMISIAQLDKKFCLVSSDDDFWPGILTSITIGSKVYHFQTKVGRVTPAHYSSTVSHNYYMKSL